MGLVLGRNQNETIRLITSDGEIVITNVSRNRTRTDIRAPKSVRVLRGELKLNDDRQPRRPPAA